MKAHSRQTKLGPGGSIRYADHSRERRSSMRFQPSTRDLSAADNSVDMKEVDMTKEAELTVPVLQELAESLLGELTTTELRRQVKERITLSNDDFAPLRNRSDFSIDQKIRNIKSHKAVVGNPICEGLIEEVPHGLRITDAGRQYLKI